MGGTWQELTSSPLINSSRRGFRAKPNPPAAVAGAAPGVLGCEPHPRACVLGL